MREAEQNISDIVRIGTSPITPVDYLTSFTSKFQAKNIQLQIIPFENNPENARHILSNLGRDIDVVMGIYDENTDQVYEKINTLTMQTLPLINSDEEYGSISFKRTVRVVRRFKGRRVYLLNAGWSHTIDALRKDIVENHPTIEVVNFPF